MGFLRDTKTHRCWLRELVCGLNDGVLEMVVLFLLVSLLVANFNTALPERSDTIWEWGESRFLDKWYQPWERCLLNITSKVKQFKFERDDCFKITGRPADNNVMFKCRLGHTYRGRPCISDNKGTYMKDVPLTMAPKGFDDPSQRHLKKMFSHLAHKNGSFLIFGDSVTVQFTQALMCEMERSRIIPVIFDIWTDKVYPLGRSKKVEEKYGRPVIVPFQHFSLNRGGKATALRIREYVNKVFETTDALAVAFNHGVWYNADNWDSDSKRFFQDDMKQVFLEFLYLARAWPQKNITVSWMETHAQHFNTTLHHPHGYYSGFREKNPKRGKRAKNYFCDPIRNTSWEADWRNDLVWKLLPSIERKYKSVSNLHLSVVHLRSLTLPLYNMHMHTDNADCTHYCVTPMMYQPAFWELERAASAL